MERLERLAVHMREAVRLAGSESVPELRLALILLDSAAELLMHRECEEQLRWQPLEQQVAQLLHIKQDTLGVLDEEDIRRLADAEAKVLSKTRQKKVEREFDAKASLLSDRGLLEPAEVRVLSKLHAYRNATYHRDTLRSETVNAAVQLYVWLNCQMMMRFSQSMWVRIVEPHPSGLAAALRHSRDNAPSQRKVAEELLAEVGLTTVEAANGFLSQHALDRLQNMEESLADSATLSNDLFGSDEWTPQAILTFAQLAMAGGPLPGEMSELLKATVPVTEQTIRAWKGRAEQLADETDAVVAFSRFADLEDEFEDVEAAVETAAIELDQELQYRIDLARGK